MNCTWHNNQQKVRKVNTKRVKSDACLVYFTKPSFLERLHDAYDYANWKGSWNQMVSTGEIIESATLRRASVKFTDASRISAGWSTLQTRRRSWFQFALYDLQKDPYGQSG